jgi:hypothetical protein
VIRMIGPRTALARELSKFIAQLLRR